LVAGFSEAFDGSGVTVGDAVGVEAGEDVERANAGGMSFEECQDAGGLGAFFGSVWGGHGVGCLPLLLEE
jgi:hypothetical protein